MQALESCPMRPALCRRSIPTVFRSTLQVECTLRLAARKSSVCCSQGDSGFEMEPSSIRSRSTMKFASLLDPRAVVAEGAGLTIAEQAVRARQLFPQLVERSEFKYWRPDNEIKPSPVRLLCGVCPTFDLGNLRLSISSRVERASFARARLLMYSIWTICAIGLMPHTGSPTWTQ